MKIQFLNPNITEEDIQQVAKVLRSGWLVLGKEAENFENNFSRYMGTKEAVATNSCTSSLHKALLVAGVKPDDEIITTPLSYVSTSNAILHCGAVPVFVDVEPETGLIDVTKIEKAITSKTTAILPVHLYGQMADMKSIKKIAKKHRLVIIEDAAHAIEAERDGIRPGQASTAACFSFHVAKNITAGQGGMLILNDNKKAELARLLRRDGVANIGSTRRMIVLGYKHLMTDFQAALLNNQLARIDQQWKERVRLFNRYSSAFKDHANIKFPKTIPGVKHACHMFIIWVDPKKRDLFRGKLDEFGIQTSIHYDPIHLEPFYKKKYGYKKDDFPIAEKLGTSTITLPLYPHLTRPEQEYVIKKVKEIGNTLNA